MFTLRLANKQVQQAFTTFDSKRLKTGVVCVLEVDFRFGYCFRAARNMSICGGINRMMSPDAALLSSREYAGRIRGLQGSDLTRHGSNFPFQGGPPDKNRPTDKCPQTPRRLVIPRSYLSN